MQSPTLPSRSLVFHSWQCWLACAIIFLSTLFFYTRGNEFPYFYHPDEPRKAEQVMKGRRNMNHPLLLLTTTSLVSTFVPGKHSQQQTVILGRWVSAGFAAAAVVMFSLTGLYLYGWIGMAAVAVILAPNALLFDLSHFMKEDTALVFGISCFVLAMTIYWRERTRESLLFLGISSALAVSGKYIGVLFPLAAAKLIQKANLNTPDKKKFKVPFWTAFGVTAALINVHVLILLPRMFVSIGKETRYIVGGNDGMTRKVPHGQPLETFLKTPFPLLILMFLYASWLLITWRKRRLDEWIVAAIPLVFGIILSMIPPYAVRYFLPISVVTYFIAALAIAVIATSLSRLWRPAGIIALSLGLITVLPTQIKALQSDWAVYRRPHDTRRVMLEQLKDIPADSIIVTDKYVRLKEFSEDILDEPLPFEIIMGNYAADVGTMDELREQGVDYVVVCGGSYDRFFDEKKIPLTENARAEQLRRRAFYEDLFENETLIWESGPRTQRSHADQVLRIYKIKTRAPASEGTPAAQGES